MNTEIDPNKTLLDLALEFSYEPPEKTMSSWTLSIKSEVELAIAYIDGVVKAEAVAHAMKIPRNNVSSWWPAVISKGIRHGLVELRMKGTENALTSFADVY